MHHHYKKIRNKIFTVSSEANVYLIHIVYLLLLITYPIVVEDLGFPLGIFTVLLAMYILFSLFLPEKMNYTIVVLGSITAVYLIYFLTEHYNNNSVHYLIKSVLLFVFALLLFSTMLADLLRSEISLRLLYQGVDCYLLLGICFTFLFRVLHFHDPAYFNFDPSEEFNHLYLSFIVLTSIGLGDLLPTTMATKAVVVLEGVLGQIYIVFFAAMIVGKYISKSITSK